MNDVDLVKNDFEVTQKWLSKMFRDAPIGLCFLDRDLRYVFINEWLAEINGTSIEEHLGRSFRDVLPDVAEGAELQLRSVLESGDPIIEGTVEAETPACPGVLRVFAHNYYPIVADDGTVVGVSCAVQDITERRRAEESTRRYQVDLENLVRERTDELRKIVEELAEEIEVRKRAENVLRASETQFRELLEAAPDAMIIAQSDGTIMFANAQASAMFGYERDEFVGSPVEQLLPSRYRKPHIAYREEYIKAPTARPMGSGRKLSAQHKDGTEFSIEVSLNLIDTLGKPLVVSAIRNVDDRNATIAEEQRHRDELAYASRISTLAEMATGIAHELNQPLGAMVMDSYTMKILAESPAANANQLRGIADRIGEQAVRASDIVRGLRNLIKRSEPQCSQTNLNSLIRQTITFLDSNIRLNAITVETNLDTPSPLVVVDPIQLQQVLVNLIRNATDAMHETPTCDRVLKIETAVFSDQLFEVAVSDSGKGVTNEEVERVFDAFFSTKPDGMGMGLAISRSIIENHGGRLWVQQISQAGAKFRFTIPFEGREAADHSRHGRTLFIIDDESMVRDALSALFVSQGRDVAVETFSSATEFLNFINLQEISDSVCMIIDERMPEISGTELVEKLITQGRRFPFVMISGHGDEALRQRAEKLGAVAFFEKPCPPSQLIDEIERVFAVSINQP